MWQMLVLLAGATVVLLLIGWRIRRHERDIGDQFDGEYETPLFHDRASPH